MAYNVKFLQGSKAAYDAITTKDLNTFYYVDGKDLYLGEIKLSNAEEIAAAIARVAAIEADYLKTADKNALQKEIDDINAELGALTGSESGQSISQMINTAVEALDNDLQPQITANANAIKAIQDDYLVEADKTELSNAIAAEKTRAEAAEKVNADAIAAVKEDVDYFFKDAGFDDPETAQVYKDTLKEIQDYINSDATAAGEMAASIKANADAIDAIEADYLKAADKTDLTNAINGKVAQSDFDTLEGRVDAVEGAVATKAESSVVEGISGKVTTLEGKVDVEKVSTAISTAVTNAVNGLDADVTSAEVEDGKGVRVQVVEVDGKVTNVAVTGNYDNKYDAKGAATTAENNAKAHAETVAGTAETNAKAYAKEYADGLAGNYATAAQGAKADSALQAADIAEGATNGTIAVKGTDVKVHGLGSAAYAADTAFDAAGSASTAEANAKAYVDTALTWGTISL